jgi:hypothetical protein
MVKCDMNWDKLCPLRRVPGVHKRHQVEQPGSGTSRAPGIGKCGT